jgi:hypothetical protein
MLVAPARSIAPPDFPTTERFMPAEAVRSRRGSH